MADNAPLARRLRRALGERAIVMVGMMGCGKTAVGRRLAHLMELKFVDADEEIEKAAGMTINEIFANLGEVHFRDGEEKVIARLLAGGPQVLATGGGAFISEATRARIKECAISVWLNAELPVLMKRVMRRDNRPLLKTPDPEGRMRELIAARYPIYALADVTVQSREVAHDAIVSEILQKLASGPLAEQSGADDERS
ncbi:MAG: shikimate kinase [Hyphomicrobiaceae bacterium]